MRKFFPSLIEYALVVWVILTLNFLLPRFMPGEPLDFLQGDETIVELDEETRQALLQYYGLDRPLLEQYVGYWRKLLTGNLGYSIYYNVPVIELIAKRFMWTVLLLGSSLVVSLLLGTVLGANMAWRRDSALDKGSFVGLLAISRIPSFIVAIFLLIVFGARLQWFPLGGARTPFTEYPNIMQEAGDILWHMALPLAALVLTEFSFTYLLVRNSMLSTIKRDFIFMARAKGIGEQRIRYHHALRNSLLPVVTLLFVKLGRLAAGSIFIENVFAYPGIGRLMFEALQIHDYPVLGACFLTLTLVVLLANFAADQVYPLLDPRMQET